jgi:hypothetical protein
VHLYAAFTARKQASHRAAHILRKKHSSSLFGGFLMLSRVPLGIAASFQSHNLAVWALDFD